MNIKLYLTLALSFCLQHLPAQTYRPLVVEGAHWQIYHQSSTGENSYGFSIEGDSTYNSIDYKKVYKLDLLEHHQLIYNEDSTSWEPVLDYLSLEGKQLFGIIREDTEEQKVYSVIFDEHWLSACPANEEQLLYDFSVNAGAVHNSCISPVDGDYSFLVDSIKTREIWAAERRFFYSQYDYMIEGMGFGGILFEAAKTSPFLPDEQKELWDYCVGTDEECLLLTNTEDKLPQKEVSISPNPFQTNINIKTEGNYDLMVFNLLGEPIFHQKGFYGASKIDLSYLPAGSYFVELAFKDGNKVVKPCIK